LTKLSILLFGSLEVNIGGKRITAFESGRARALLAYLAAEAGKPQTRPALAGLLWPDWPDEAAQKNLRHSLYSLRKSLQDAGADAGFLRSDRNAIVLEPGEACFIDTVEFSARLSAAKANLSHSGTMDSLAEAAHWVRGPFLDGLMLKDSPAFETWLVARREYQDQQALSAWAILAEWCARNGEFDQAEAYIRSQLNLEPWRESAHRHLMRIYAQQGRGSEALAQYESFRRTLKTELKTEPSPETSQLAEQIRNQAYPELLSPAPSGGEGIIASRVPSQTLHNLRESLSRFIGREEDAAKIKALFSLHRLISLVGPGGVGKTRLALSVASELLQDFEHGVWLVELAALNEPELVTQVVASTFQLRKSQNQSLNATLLDYLRHKRLLLVLDNCEHLVDASARLAARILSQCPAVAIMATSRERLNLDGEVVYTVLPLRTPDSNVSLAPESLERVDSVRLFLDRGKLVRPDFTLSADNVAAIAQICRRLDGIPLALELAAARLQVLNVHQIAQRLDDRFRLLTGGKRGVFAHQQTLLASIDWSHGLLAECEQRLFRRLSVFSGGWTLEAAEMVCAGNGLEPFEILEFLAQLVNKSLVDVLANVNGAPRYRMLETIRQYAHEKLAETGEEESIHLLHLDYYLAYGESFGESILYRNSIQAVDELDREIDNFRQAIQYAYDRPEPDHLIQGLRLATVLGWYWDVRGRVMEGYRWLMTGIGRATSLETEPDRVLAEAYYHAGNLVYFLDDTDDSLGGRSLLDKSIAYARQSDHRMVQAIAQARLAGYLMNKFFWPSVQAQESPEYQRACTLVDSSLSLSESLGNKATLTYGLFIKGILVFYSGDFTVARQIMEESLVLAQEIADLLTIHAVLLHLGALLVMQGKYAESTACYLQGLEGSRKLGNKRDTMLFLTGLMTSSMYGGKYLEIEAWGREGLGLCQEMDNKRAAVFFNRSLAVSYLRRGLYAQAARQLEASLVLAQQIADDYGFLVYLALMAGVAVGFNQSSQAARWLGAVETGLQTFFKPFDEHDQFEILRITLAGQAQISEEAWDHAFAAGRRLSFDQALEEATELGKHLDVSN
jgi:predicted ATPase/DNA-binding SARP family transcriptional activator